MPGPARLEHLTAVKSDLKNITRDAEEGQTVKIENFVGFTKVPLGLAGPLEIHGHHQNGSFVAPLATVESTLVASANRGCKAFQRHGGVKAYAMSEGMGRAPVFIFNNVDDAVAFCLKLPDFEGQLRKEAEKTSRHARLTSLTPHIIGNKVHLHFEYTCGDAAGQNMTEIATYQACSKFLSSTGSIDLDIIDMYPEGQLSADKQITLGKGTKPSRGVKVIAWGVLSDKTCREVLQTPSSRLHDAILTGADGAIRNSLAGSSINPANLLAAMFIATGQDAASVVESCWGQLSSSLDQASGDITLSLFLPSVVVGSIGGGTVYPTQKEALNLLGCVGTGKKWALAETMAAFALALDTSTAASVANNSKAASHRRFARASRL